MGVVPLDLLFLDYTTHLLGDLNLNSSGSPRSLPRWDQLDGCKKDRRLFLFSLLCQQYVLGGLKFDQVINSFGKFYLYFSWC